MARSRNIKPGLFLNEELVECSFAARYLFTGLWTQADCFGRLENRPKRLKMALLPCDDIDVAALLQELADHGFIAFYGNDLEANDPNQPYIWITGFERHQNPHKKELDAGSQLPAPPKGIPGPDPVKTRSKPGLDPTQTRSRPDLDPVQHDPGPADSLNLIPDSLNLIPHEPALPESSKPSDLEDFRLAWNRIAEECGLTQCRTITAERGKKLRQRLKDPDWRKSYPEALERLRTIKWIRGNSQYGPRGIDWLLQPDTLTKVLEGTYDDNKRDYSHPSPDDSAGLF